MTSVFAQSDTMRQDLSIDATLGAQAGELDQMKKFKDNSLFESFFIAPDTTNSGDQVRGLFEVIAFNIKNAVILIAVIFLIVGVIKLLFSDASDDDLKTWKNNIFYSAIGIFFMQISYSIWRIGIDSTTGGGSFISATLSWKLWYQVLAPIVQLLQYGASFAFIAMMFYAFYLIISGNGDEEKRKKGIMTLVYGIIGFALIKLPFLIVQTFYKGVKMCSADAAKTLFDFATPNNNCVINNDAAMSKGIELIAKIFSFLNNFLTLACVIMALYAGWLLFISRGEDDKVKQAKNIFIYIVIGLILLIISHALFAFLIDSGTNDAIINS